MVIKENVVRHWSVVKSEPLPWLFCQGGYKLPFHLSPTIFCLPHSKPKAVTLRENDRDSDSYYSVGLVPQTFEEPVCLLKLILHFPRNLYNISLSNYVNSNREMTYLCFLDTHSVSLKEKCWLEEWWLKKKNHQWCPHHLSKLVLGYPFCIILKRGARCFPKGKFPTPSFWKVRHWNWGTIHSGFSRFWPQKRHLHESMQ